jgi:hypothetical protein
MIMNTNTTNDVVTNENNDDVQNDDNATTTRTRATTRALTNAKIKLRANENERVVKIDDTNEIKIVRTSTKQLRIDHSLCAHTHDKSITNQKNARSQCRARVAQMNANK